MDVKRQIAKLFSLIEGLVAGAVPLSSATPQPVGTADDGVGTSASRDDHVHAHGNQLGGALHADAVAGGASGFLSGTDKTKLNNTSGTNSGDQAAGAGLTGTSTLNVIAHADNSITVNADSIQVGVLASDAQHGNRGGAGIHSAATNAAAGFASAAHITALEAATALQHAAVTIGTANGLSLATQALSLAAAGAASAGAVTTGTQTIAGDKTITGVTLFNPTNVGMAANVKNSSSSGYSALEFFDDGGTARGSFGWGNTGAGVAGLRSKLFFSTDNTTDFLIQHNTVTQATFAAAGGTTLVGDLLVDTPTFKVDAANNRVGVGTASPLYLLDLFTTLGNTKLAMYGDSVNPYGFGIQANDLRIHTDTSSSKISFRPGAAAASTVEISGAGVLNGVGAASITMNSVAVVTISNTVNLSNKAFTTGNSFSGSPTISGDATLSGNLTLSGTCPLTGTFTYTNPIRYSNNMAITAFAGGGQASAVALTKQINRVTTCATNGDSVKHSTAVAGQWVTVFNDGAASLDVFPASGAAINALGTNNAFAIAAGASAEFYALTTTLWKTR